MRAAPRQSLFKKARQRKSRIVRHILKWAKTNSPAYPWRKHATPYSILVSEMLLRKTRADRVSEVFPLFLKQFPGIEALAHSSTREVRRTIRSLGRLKRDREIVLIARAIDQIHAGKIPKSEKSLLAVIGKQSRYTVNAIRCFAYGEKVPIFDVNVNRIYSRIFSLDFGKQPHKNETAWRLAQSLLPVNKVKEYNWALLDIGRKICTKEPKCELCPLIMVCDYGRNAMAASQK